MSKNMDSVEYASFLNELLKKNVKVGLPEGTADQKYPDTNISVLEVGVINENGFGQKRRSFIKDTFEIRNRDLQKDMDKVLNNEVKKGSDVNKIMDIIGSISQGYIFDAFDTGGFGRWAPDSPATIKAKGSSKPLIDTGLLRQSITWVVGDDD